MNLYTGKVNDERWPVDRSRGWNAGLTYPLPCVGGGGGEVHVRPTLFLPEGGGRERYR